MPRGGKRAGAGRLPKKDRKVALLVRVAPELRRQIERARGRQSLSRFAETLLTDALATAPKKSDRQVEALLYLFKQAAACLQAADRKGAAFDFQKDRTDFEAFSAAITHLLNQFAPTGKFDPSRYSMFSTPDEAGRIVGSIVWTFLTTEKTKMWDHAKHRAEPRGSLFLGFPNAANDLGLNAKKQSGEKP